VWREETGLKLFLRGDFGDDLKWKGMFGLDGHKVSGAVVQKISSLFTEILLNFDFRDHLTGYLHNLAVPTITVGVVTTRLYNAV